MDCKRRFYVLRGFGVANVSRRSRSRRSSSRRRILFSSPYPLLALGSDHPPPAAVHSARRALGPVSERANLAATRLPDRTPSPA